MLTFAGERIFWRVYALDFYKGHRQRSLILPHDHVHFDANNRLQQSLPVEQKRDARGYVHEIGRQF